MGRCEQLQPVMKGKR